MKRRAHIEFLSHTSLLITTTFLNKVVKLKKSDRGKYIDLISLKVCDHRTDFYAYIAQGNGTVEEPFTLEIKVKTSKYGDYEKVNGTKSNMTWMQANCCGGKETFEAFVID